jgi:type I restriction enzyme S subunit
VQVRRLARLGTGHTPSRQHPEYWENCTIPWLTLADVWQLRDGTKQVVTETAEKISELGLANSAAVLHPAGTVALSRTASVGFSCILGRNMATSQDFATWACGPKLLPKFLLWALRGTIDEIRATTMGSTHKTIYMPDIEQIDVPLPPVEVQKAIADFLDAETARIDALIKKKRRMIELLDLRAIRLAFDVITGRDDSTQRKPSGVPWLGDVPVGWDVAPIRSRYTVQVGRMLNAERAASGDLQPYLRNFNVRWDDFDLTDVAEMDFPPEERRRYALTPGDLLVCEGGAGIARAALWSGSLVPCYFGKSLHRVRATGPWPVEWILEWLRVSKWLSAFQVEGNLATIPHLTGEQLRAHRLPFPAPNRARQLLGHLSARRRVIEHANAKLVDQIDLLLERRKALITAAVTGNLDVASAA